MQPQGGGRRDKEALSSSSPSSSSPSTSLEARHDKAPLASLNSSTSLKILHTLLWKMHILVYVYPPTPTLFSKNIFFLPSYIKRGKVTNRKCEEFKWITKSVNLFLVQASPKLILVWGRKWHRQATKRGRGREERRGGEEERERREGEGEKAAHSETDKSPLLLSLPFHSPILTEAHEERRLRKSWRWWVSEMWAHNSKEIEHSIIYKYV